MRSPSSAYHVSPVVPSAVMILSVPKCLAGQVVPVRPDCVLYRGVYRVTGGEKVMAEASPGNMRMFDDRPGCFGNLDRVFPMTEDGLRRSSERCAACPEKSECLRAAVSGENQITVEEEKVDRAYKSGKISFLQRWSKKKMLHKRRVGK